MTIRRIAAASLIGAILLLFWVAPVRAQEPQMDLDLKPGGSVGLNGGMWTPEGSSAVWCEGAGCTGAVTIIMPGGSGPTTFKTGGQHPMLANLRQFQGVSAQGECTITITTRTTDALAGKVACKNYPTTKGLVDVRGDFSQQAFGAASAPTSVDTEPESVFGEPAVGGAGETSGGTLGLPASPPTVLSGFEIIDRYDVNLVIRDDGLLDVTERISYDFGTNDRHGIERFIPVKYRLDAADPLFETHDRVLKIDDIEVETDAPDNLEKRTSGADLVMRIGDPDETITGKHTYTISYTVAGAMNPDKDDPEWDGEVGDHDELYWNAIGTEWDAPIADARVTVQAPAEILEASCYAGSFGSTATCAKGGANGSKAAFSQPGLYPGQGMTVAISLPVGAVPTPTRILEERWSLGRAFTVNPLTIGLTAVLAVGLIGGLVVMMWRVGRDRVALGGAVDAAFAGDDSEDQANPLFGGEGSPVEFAPPDDIRPGQIGTLVDGVANPLDVTATIVDMAARGIIRIEEVPKEGLFGKDDYRLVRLGIDESGLLPYERTLLEGLFDGAGTEVLLSDLKLLFAAKLERVQNALYADVTKRKWFSARPDKVRQRWSLIGFGAFAAAILVFVAAVWFTHFGLVAIPVLVAALVLWVGAKWMPRRTAKGTGVLRRSLGFRTFITDSEALRARFAEDNNIFTEYLPYAIVFGCAKKFAKAFEGLEDQMPEQTWYVGHRPFHPVAFADNMSSFAVSTGGTLASTPGSSGSSGGGGGGSSGGGMGGGGGGSW